MAGHDCGADVAVQVETLTLSNIVVILQYVCTWPRDLLENECAVRRVGVCACSPTMVPMAGPATVI
jgi:hypothetical protein